MNAETKQFLLENQILWQPIQLEISQNSKRPIFHNGRIPKQTDWEQLSREEIIKRQEDVDEHEFIAIDTREFIHFDIDFKEDVQYEEETEQVAIALKEMLPYYKSATKKRGFHAFCKTDHIFNSKRVQTKYKDIELLTGQWAFMPKTRKIKNINAKLEIMEKEAEFFEQLIVNNNDSGNEGEEEETSTSGKSSDYLTNIVNNISLKYIDEYDAWIKLLFALKNDSKNNYNLAKSMSKKSTKYDDDKFNEIWNSSKSGNTIGTVHYYSRKSNELNYLKIQASQFVINADLGTDHKLATLFMESNDLNYVYKNDMLYTYNRGKWATDKNNRKLIAHLQKFLFELFNVKVGEINNQISIKLQKGEDYKDLTVNLKFLKKIITSILGINTATNIGKSCLILMSLRDYSHIEFDSNGFLYAFKNQTYDLRTLKIHKPNRTDYILTWCNYDYEKSTKEQITKLDKLLDQIFPDFEIKKQYIHYLSTCLYGVAIEKFIIANGGGGNGKGVLNELIMAMLDNYGYVAPNNILLQPLKTGSNPEVANMNNKRLVIYREPDSENSKLCGSTIKELCGGGEISARMNYSNDMKVVLTATHILECNKKPKIDGRIDESYVRRLMDIPFKSTFTDNENTLAKDLDNVFKADVYFKSTEFKNEYKSVLFDYLIYYIKKNPDPCSNLYNCQEVLERTEQYLEDSDELFNVISQFYVKSEDKSDVVKMADLFKMYKSSDYYANLSKKKKLNQNMKWLGEEMKTNVNFKNFYKNKYSYNDEGGKQFQFNKCLIYFKRVEKDLTENDGDFLEDDDLN
tara:strand:+ start:27 stop:2423 length:2397 start_codon:yes stop_codon:yes gene_type:complete